MGFPIILLCCGIAFGGDFSTLNPGVEVPSRYLYQMGLDGCLPGVFGKLHPKYRTPHVAIIFVGIVAFLLILTNSINFVAQINICSLFWSYIIGFISFAELRRKEPDLPRPYRAPWATFSVVSSVIIYALMGWSCGWEHVGISFVVTGCALLFYLVYGRKRAVSQEEIKAIQAAEAATLEKDIPDDATKGQNGCGIQKVENCRRRYYHCSDFAVCDFFRALMWYNIRVSVYVYIQPARLL